MISYNEAVSVVFENRWKSSPELIPVKAAGGRRLAEPIVARLDSPPYTNSAMDGYAVGSLDGPWTIIGSSPAGAPICDVGRGEAAQVNTGSQIADGTVAVIAKEDVQVLEDDLRAEPAKPGQHIRIKAEEYLAGTQLFEGGTRITPPVMSAISAQGFDRVPVLSMPRVAILSTGSEMLTPGEPYSPGRMYESNSMAIAEVLRTIGCPVVEMTVRDDVESTVHAVQGLLNESDVLITLGGVSVGEFDFVRRSVKENGVQLLFSGVAIKPGKPISFGVRDDTKTWFGLPGNPMSALITFCLFVLTFLGEPLRFRPAPLGEPLARRPGREEFVPAWMTDRSTLCLRPTIGSHALNGLAYASGLARVPADCSSLGVDSTLDYADFPWSVRA